MKEKVVIMYRVKIFRTHISFVEDLENYINEFLIGKDIEIVDCKITAEGHNIVYVVMYKVW